MKKLLSILIVLLLVAGFAAPALARCSHHGGTQSASYSVCSTQSCTLTAVHTHSGTTYSAHYYNDGHDYHEYCDIADCTLTGYHGHDGVYCFGHTYNDGHSYHRTGRGHHR